MIHVVLPEPLCVLARVDREVNVEVQGVATQRAVIDALEAAYPVLRGTIRDYATDRRRAYLRFFACGLDLSHEAPDAPLPEEVADGREPFLVVEGRWRGVEHRLRYRVHGAEHDGAAGATGKLFRRES